MPSSSVAGSPGSQSPVDILTETTVDEARIDELADDFASRADEHDRKGTFAFENVAALKEAGVNKLMVPVEWGGTGGDLPLMIRVLRRIGRGDASTALVLQVHLVTVAALSVEAMRGDEKLERFLKDEVAKGKLCHLFSGAAEFEGRGPTTATKTEGGFIINGRKGFGTGCLVADYGVTPTIWQKSETERLNIRVLYPMDAPGLTLGDNWDSFGMRATGSHDYWFEEMFVPDENVLRIIPEPAPGTPPDPLSVGFLIGGLSTFGAMYLGVADAAFLYTKRALAQRTPLGSLNPSIANAGLQFYIGEIDQKLREASAMLESTAYRHRDPMSWSAAAIGDIVAMKDSVTRKAVDIVEMCMTALGGPAYYRRCPLGRYYRDVRAGPIHPVQHAAAVAMLGKAVADSVEGAAPAESA